jgi:predicted lipoprotein with Yx(FWY)xxD motif
LPSAARLFLGATGHSRSVPAAPAAANRAAPRHVIKRGEESRIRGDIHMRTRHFGLIGTAAVALLIAACGSSASSTGTTGTSTSAPAASGSALKTTTIGGATVLTNAKGFTLYWFAPDTSTTSKCTGSCATYWPPVKGPATAGSGVTGTLATITRPDGTTQATWNGHPLYTYAADTAPGQAAGNGLNVSGGVWHEVTISGSPAPAATPSSKGGYGY